MSFSQEKKYELEQRKSRYNIHIIIKEELLNNSKNVDGYIGKRLKAISIDYSILFIMLEENMNLFKAKLPTISSDYGKINYIFSVLEEQISKP